MLERALLYFIPSQGRDDIAKGGEFLKIQPGTGDNLSPKDIAEGYTDYVIWNRFRPGSLDIDGELEMECLDSGMVLLKMDPIASLQDDMIEAGMNPTFPIHEVLGKVLNMAYGQNAPGAIPLLW